MTDTHQIDAYRACKFCGKPFKVVRLDIAKYCSTNCRVKAWQAREKAKRDTTARGTA